MPVLRISLFLAICLFVASCGGKKTATKTTLVLAGAIDSIAGQAGGTIIYGRQTSGGTNSFAIMLPYAADLELPNGNWTFAAVSWDGDGSSYLMEGVTRCALVPVELAGGEQSVSLSLSTAGCNSQFFGDANSKEVTGQPKKFVPGACAFTQKDGRVDENNCVNSVAQSFKIELPQKLPGGGVAPGLVSRCLAENTLATSEMDYTGNLRVPMFFPLIADQGIIKITLFEDASCTQSPQTTIISNPLAGIGTRALELESGTENSLYIHNPPCVGIAGNQATPFTSGGVNVLCNATQISGYMNTNPSFSYRLGRNIDFSLQATSSTPIVSNFTGSLDGGGYGILGLQFDTPTVSNIGLFNILSGSVKNLKIANSSITGISNIYNSIGILAGSALNGVQVENVEIINSSIDLSGTSAPASVGLAIGYYNSPSTPGYIRNLKILDSTMDIAGHTSIGGAIGKVDGVFAKVEEVLVRNLTMQVDSTSGGNIGGAIGATINSATLRNIIVSNLNMGNAVTALGGNATANNVGGAVGSLNNGSTLENVKVDGAIYSASDNVGGIVGLADATVATAGIVYIRDAISQLAILNGAFNVGGILGTATGSATEQVDILRARYLGNKTGATGYIECDDVCAGLVASLSGAGAIHQIAKSWVKNANIKTTAASPVSVAGLVAEGTSATISEVFVEADIVTVNTVNFAAGLLADFADPYTVNSTYFRGSVTANATNAALLFTKVLNATLIDIYSVSTIASSLKGDYALGAPTTITNVYTTQPTPNGGTYLSDADIRIGSNLTFSNAVLWSDLSAAGDGSYKNLEFYKSYSSFAQSSLGTDSDPFIIDSVASWNSIGDQAQFMGSVFKLGANLDFSAQTFNPIASTTYPFHGTLKGNNKAISNVNLTGDADSLGIIRAITTTSSMRGNVGVIDQDRDSSTYNKLYLNNITFSSSGSVGAVVGSAVDTYAAPADVDNPQKAVRFLGVVVSNSSITSTGSAEAGGAFGSLEVNNGSTEIRDITVQNSTIVASVGSTHAAGLVGKLTNSSGYAPANQGRIESNRSLSNTITGATGVIGVGGVFGYYSAPSMETRKIIANSSVDGDQSVGGVVGDLAVGRIAEATSRGSVQGNTNVGGFVGSLANAAIVTGSYSIASVNVLSANAGAGFVGTAVAGSIIQNSWSAPSSLTGTIHQAVPIAVSTEGGSFSPLVYVGTDDGFANSTHATDADLKNEAFYNTNFISTDPFMHVPGLYPVPYFEVFPQYFLN